MSAAAATNRVKASGLARLQHSGSAVNPSIPVAGMAPWRREAIQKAIAFNRLAPNWDSYGSHAPGMAAMQTAVEFLRTVPGETLPVPMVVPVSGGGLHFEWTVGDRELEVAIAPSGAFEMLRVENGMPLERENLGDLREVFAWLDGR